MTTSPKERDARERVVRLSLAIADCDSEPDADPEFERLFNELARAVDDWRQPGTRRRGER